jgi:hypothetical protein
VAASRLVAPRALRLQKKVWGNCSAATLSARTKRKLAPSRAMFPGGGNGSWSKS